MKYDRRNRHVRFIRCYFEPGSPWTEERLDGPAKERFIKLPLSHQREWARYISEAKKDETKLRRIEKMKVDLLKP